MAVVTEEPERTSEEERISEAPWDGSAGRFTDEQYQRSCVLDRKSCGADWVAKPPKSRCSLPIKEPGGELSRAGVHAAASRIGSVTNACPAAVSSAKGKLRSAYKQLGEDAPDSIKSDESKSTQVDAFVAEYGVIPGVPRHNVEGVRGIIPGSPILPFEFIRAEDAGENLDNGIGLLRGHFAVFDKWTEIDSFFEGRFMERIAPGAFKKTFDENGSNIRCLFNHGRDPQIGMKVLGKPRTLKEDQEGALYEVPLFDTSYNRDLLPGLKGESQYGASFRFRVIREEINTKPGKSSTNPEGIEERSITEASVSEFGPVTFPAYPTATSGVRSMLRDFLEDQMGGEAAYVALTRSGSYHPYHFFVDPDEVRAADGPTDPQRGTEPEGDSSTPPAEDPAREAESEEPAPPSDAPARDYLRTTHLPGAARQPLRTTRNPGAPPWEL
jgi:hypothetical protein